MKNTFIRCRFLLAFIVFIPFFTIDAVDYYYNGNGSVSEISSWYSNRNGTGDNPLDFTTAGNTFIVQNGQTAALSSAWTISGSNSALLLETGSIFQTGLNNPAVTLHMQSGATFLMENSSYSNLNVGTLNSNSNFELATQSAPRLSNLIYGNLIFSGTSAFSAQAGISTTGSLVVNDSGQLRLTNSAVLTHTVGRDFSIASGSSVSLNQGTGSMVLNVAGNFTNSGILSKPGSGSAELNFTGSNPATATWGSIANTNFNNFTINLASGKNLTFQDSLDAGAASVVVNGTLNLGSQVLSGSLGNFTLASGATLITAHANGLNGAVTMTGNRSFHSSANYEFRGAGTGSLLPSAVNQLTIDRSIGLVTLDGAGSTQSVSGSLNLLSGGLSAGATKNSISVGSLVMRNAEIASNLATTLNGDVTFDASHQGRAKIAGALHLGGSTRTFQVGNGSDTIDMEVTGGISSGGVTKTGLGTMSISGINDYQSITTVSAGTLYVSGSLGQSAVDVQARAALGSGGASGTLGVGLFIREGGRLDLSGATLGASSQGILTISGGELSLGKLTFEDLVGWDWRNAGVGTYQLIAGDFAVDWGVTQFLSRETAFDFGNGYQGYFTSGSLNAVIVPEPCTSFLAGISCVIICFRRRAISAHDRRVDSCAG